MKILLPVISLSLIAIYVILEPYQGHIFGDQTPQVLSHELVATPAPPRALAPAINGPTVSSHQTTAVPSRSEIEGLPELTASAAASPIARIRQLENKTALHEAILTDHQDYKRYPAFNNRFITPEKDPVMRRYEKDIRTTREKDTELALTIWTDEKFYLKGDEVSIYALLEDQNGLRQATRFAAQLIYNERESLLDLSFSDNDNDGIYQAAFRFEDATNTHRPGVYKALIVNDQNVLTDSVAFVLSEPEAQFTGLYRDRISEEGHLIIEAELAVATNNRYALEASLYSSTNDPIGQTQHALTLAAGTHWVPLTFHGLLFHDAGEPGPYLLKHVSLAKVSMPIQRAPMQATRFFTEGYTVDEFSSLPEEP